MTCSPHPLIVADADKEKLQQSDSKYARYLCKPLAHYFDYHREVYFTKGKGASQYVWYWHNGTRSDLFSRLGKLEEETDQKDLQSRGLNSLRNGCRGVPP